MIKYKIELFLEISQFPTKKVLLWCESREGKLPPPLLNSAFASRVKELKHSRTEEGGAADLLH